MLELNPLDEHLLIIVVNLPEGIICMFFYHAIQIIDPLVDLRAPIVLRFRGPSTSNLKSCTLQALACNSQDIPVVIYNHYSASSLHQKT
jgi:hypothetical protein